MDKRTYIGMACGLIFVGFILIIMDFLVARLSNKLNRPGSTVLKDETELTFATEDERRRYRMRRRNLLAIQTHKMRRGGIFVGGAGLIIFIVLLCTPSFQSFPNQDIILNIGNFITKKIQVPWGQFSIPAALILFLIAFFLFAAGVEHWKLRQNYARSVMCFLLGMIFLLEGIFQWG